MAHLPARYSLSESTAWEWSARIGKFDLEKTVITLKNISSGSCGIVSVPITVPVTV